MFRKLASSWFAGQVKGLSIGCFSLSPPCSGCLWKAYHYGIWSNGGTYSMDRSRIHGWVVFYFLDLALVVCWETYHYRSARQAFYKALCRRAVVVINIGEGAASFFRRGAFVAHYLASSCSANSTRRVLRWIGAGPDSLSIHLSTTTRPVLALCFLLCFL